MLEREIYTEISGCKLIPIQKEAVTRTLAITEADPFRSFELDLLAVDNSNPGLNELLNASTPFTSVGLVMRLYHEGVARTYRMFVNQAIANEIIIPRVSEIKSQAIAQGIARKNSAILNSFEHKHLESLYKKLGDDLAVEHGPFVDGVREIAKYSYFGDSFGIGAFDTFRFMYDFLSGKPIKVWFNPN